jgi:hypothetical protein
MLRISQETIASLLHQDDQNQSKNKLLCCGFGIGVGIGIGIGSKLATALM